MYYIYSIVYSIIYTIYIVYMYMHYIVLYAPAFYVFCKYWPDDGLLRPKLVANNRIIIK